MPKLIKIDCSTIDTDKMSVEAILIHVQWKPLNVITLGLRYHLQNDNNKWLPTDIPKANRRRLFRTWSTSDHIDIISDRIWRLSLYVTSIEQHLPARMLWRWPPPCFPPDTPAGRGWTRAGDPSGSWPRRSRRARRRWRRKQARGRPRGKKTQYIWNSKQIY